MSYKLWKKKDLWPHLRMKASLSTHELPRAKWLPFFKVVACKDFVTKRYAWFIAGPWYGMYDLLPVHDTVCMMYCRSMTRYVWFIAGPWYGMYDLLPVHDTVCMIYCPSMTRYALFIARPWYGMYDLLPVDLVNDVVVITQNWSECTAVY